MSSVGNFKETAIKIIKQIPYGRVTTYGTIAVMAGMPRGARLVGEVLHGSSEKYDLPWQRVINKQGYISIRGNDYPKAVQKALLEQEGVVVSDDFMVDLEKYGWWGNETNLDNS